MPIFSVQKITVFWRARSEQGAQSLAGILSTFLGRPEEELGLRKRSSGKWEVDSEFGIDFSVSHTKDLWAVAIAKGIRVGLDVEFLGRDFNYLGIAKRYFSLAEVQSILGRDPLEQKSFFLNLWTKKEALIKAMESSISKGLDIFSEEILQEAGSLTYDANWMLRLLSEFGSSYVAHLAVESGKAFDISVERLKS